MLNDLTAEQRHSLQMMQPVLGLAADLAHAAITIYLPDEDKKYLFIYKQAQPTTQLGNVRPDMTGRRVRCVEEPLVARSLQRGLAVSGIREWSLGVFSSIRLYPLKDNFGKCYGVISFEATAPDNIIIDQAWALLCNLRQSVDGNPNYQRMTPDDGLMVVDINKQIIAANSKAKHIFEIMGIEHMVGRRTSDVAINWPLVGMVIDTGSAEGKDINMHGRILSLRILPVAPKPKAGCAIVLIKDITELRKKDEELLIKSVVIKEIHHRVKNNLQTIASLLRLQSRRAQSSETKAVLQDCIGRVNSIAIVHEYLSQQDTGLIDVAKVAKGIYQAIISSMLNPGFRLTANFCADEVQLPSEQATSLALILNELLQNTIEHAFEGREQGSLEVRFANEDDCYVLVIADDGVGLPADFCLEETRSSLGLKIIKTMAEADLHGRFTLENRVEGGALAKVIVPKGVDEG